MSVVTTVLMLPHRDEPAENIAAFNEALKKVRPGEGDFFRNLSEVHPHPEPSPSDHWGGSKCPEADVWAAALNHISGHEVLSVASVCRWNEIVNFLWHDNGGSWQAGGAMPRRRE